MTIIGWHRRGNVRRHSSLPAAMIGRQLGAGGDAKQSGKDEAADDVAHEPRRRRILVLGGRSCPGEAGERRQSLRSEKLHRLRVKRVKSRSAARPMDGLRAGLDSDPLSMTAASPPVSSPCGSRSPPRRVRPSPALLQHHLYPSPVSTPSRGRPSRGGTLHEAGERRHPSGGTLQGAPFTPPLATHLAPPAAHASLPADLPGYPGRPHTGRQRAATGRFRRDTFSAACSTRPASVGAGRRARALSPGLGARALA